MAAAVPSTKKKLLSNFMRRKEQGTRVPRKSPTTREGMFLSQGVSVENFREVRRCFVAKAGDVFVASYPKSGTTWMQHIVSLIKNNGVDDGEDLDDKWLWIEQFSLAEVEQYSVHGAGLYKTHLPYSLLPGLSVNSPAKYIYVYRNPKDVAVSYYHHTQAMDGPIPWDKYVESFMTGGEYIHLGPIFENHLEWWEHKGDSNSLFMSYEQMKADLHSSIRMVATFLGHDIDDAMVNKIAEQCTFTAMKKNDAVNKTSIKVFDKEFLRKGVVGDWRNHFTAEQSAKMDALVAEKTAGTSLVYDYGQ